ncbi:MAG: cobaltochelatase subunit CobN [Rhodospirillales bacterium]|nr:cobaltochelatase subunit CobN [Rhodospirillales bacterium]
MHLLAATPGLASDGSEAIDLGQTPGDIVVLSAADSELACLALAQKQAVEKNKETPSVRLASLLNLGHNMSVDLYVEDVIGQAKLVVARVLGGRGYWQYGIEQVSAVCREKNIPVIFLPGDDQPDAELTSFSTVPQESIHRLWQYMVHGGMENASSFLGYCHELIGSDGDWVEPAPLMKAGVYGPEFKENGKPVVAITFYRALVQAGNLAIIDAMVEALKTEGLNPLPVFVSSLKDQVVGAIVTELFEQTKPSVILNATGFAISAPGAKRSQTPFDGADCPILQVVFSGGNEEVWRENPNGLSARDIAMNVALPEVDGRILSRAVSFKGLKERDPLTETDIVVYQPVSDRVVFVAKLAAGWAKLRQAPASERKVALILANYPNRDGRMGNGVGLDTPAGTIKILKALESQGYNLEGIPENGNALVEHIQQGPTNDYKHLDQREVRETLSMADYQCFFSGLPPEVQGQVTKRWGTADTDPFYRAGELDCGKFLLPIFRCGNIAIGLQPARGYNIDPESTYHDPDLVPPHSYLAFYAWIRASFNANTVIHMGKHGNLEWLPGKSLALSQECFPEAILGPLPHLYPFIVNDPGEGTQAKRRAQAVIIDHMTPPLTRAESYGPLKDLELLVDEYYQAAGVDPRRLKVLRKEILQLSYSTGLAEDCGIKENENQDNALAKLDNHLCELKEMQIRDGLHIFGESPTERLLDDTLIALARVPRNKGEGGDASILRALAKDLNLDFDPLDCDMSAPWMGERPDVLTGEGLWRSEGDTIERLEELAIRLVSGEEEIRSDWVCTAAVLDTINQSLRPAVEACGPEEIKGLLTGLEGRFIEPGPSGAPTRGKPEVLPTGRNFYSVDTRAVPTPAAWTLGWKSANLLIERHMQEHGAWPRTMALTAWGTSNMRTGGDDIAQGLALMGVRPTWDSLSKRVTGFEILPLDLLDRPRVDVTLRISGFFRDAFPGLIDLFDSATRAVAELDEPDNLNFLAARVKEERQDFEKQGMSPEEAANRSGYRVFGSKPGAYGAGLQALIDEKGWETDADLARAYVAWGGYAYGAGAKGNAAHGLFERRLSSVEAVVQNQDNREHDILDSDDYYQFEGGMTAAVRNLSGEQPTVYHNDHSRPETPRVRTLEEEIARVVRARVVNPKWIQGVMRHGYKGAFEMTATVDYLFAFAATARCVKDHHFDLVMEAYLEDEEVRSFLEENNPAALQEMADRLNEALERGLWKPKSNSAHMLLGELSKE